MDLNLIAISPDGPSGIRGSSSTEQKATVLGSHGKKLSNISEVSFAPFGSGDVFEQCAGINIARNKAPVPIVPADHHAEASLQQGKLDRIQFCTEQKQDATTALATASNGLAKIAESEQELSALVPRNDAEKKIIDDAIGAFATPKQKHTANLQRSMNIIQYWDKHLSAAQATEILSPAERLSDLPEKATVHLPGHGTANSSYLSTLSDGGESKHLKVVAHDLKTAGLPKSARVKLDSCHSADNEVRSTFVANPPSSKWGFLEDTVAPAKTLAVSLGQPVIGYQGVGKTNGRMESGHNLRADGSGNVRRASEVRKEFLP
jgi:hypothetical protein